MAGWFSPRDGRLFAWLQQLTGLELNAGNTAQAITDVIVDTGLAALISMILWLVLFSLLMILVRRISGKLRLINRIPVIGTANGF